MAHDGVEEDENEGRTDWLGLRSEFSSNLTGHSVLIGD